MFNHKVLLTQTKYREIALYCIPFHQGTFPIDNAYILVLRGTSQQTCLYSCSPRDFPNRYAYIFVLRPIFGIFGQLSVDCAGQPL